MITIYAWALNQMGNRHPVEYQLLLIEEKAAVQVTRYSDDKTAYYRERARIRGRVLVRLKHLFPDTYEELKEEAKEMGLKSQ